MNRNHSPLSWLRRLTVTLILAGASLSIAVAPVLVETAQGAEKVDFQRLAGRWIRPDGGYILELKGIKKDGTVRAAYFNPRPIKVGNVELRREKGELLVFVELRDINYPGSTYNLRYDPATDRLKGTYFQAVEQVTYEIEFVRSE